MMPPSSDSGIGQCGFEVVHNAHFARERVEKYFLTGQENSDEW
jgi:hypothetical protein